MRCYQLSGLGRGRLALGGLVVVCLAQPAFVQDCNPLRPPQPVNSEAADKTRANASVLLKSLGSGEIENEYKKIQKMY
jgi:hypothetical protein